MKCDKCGSDLVWCRIVCESTLDLNTMKETDIEGKAQVICCRCKHKFNETDTLTVLALIKTKGEN